MAMHKWTLSPRQLFDLELLLVGGFSPLSGFLSEDHYDSVVHTARLASGHLWPIPITLDVPAAYAECISVHDQIGLYQGHTLLATMTVSHKWRPNKKTEAQCVYGTEDLKHPGVFHLFKETADWYLGGPVRCVELPAYYDFPELRHTPKQLKSIFKEKQWGPIVGFQTRNPIHRAHMALTLKATENIKGHVLLHPVVGMTKPGDIDHYARVRCYQAILKYYPKGRVFLSLLPLAMRMAGPREALWHALVRKNYGCTHFIVGRDHAGPGQNAKGQPFYGPYEAQALVRRYQDEIGITMVPFEEMVYVPARGAYCQAHEVKPSETKLSISGTELRHRLETGLPIPSWFSFEEVAEELRSACPPKHKKGLALFLTGLPGAGKTTLAAALAARLQALGKRNVAHLDGDVLRPLLASELGFSQEDRNANVRRIGYVASEITKLGGIAICSAIAPYQSARADNRKRLAKHGHYVEIYLSTPLAECERRDPKGLYQKARSGEIKNFTGISGPYEVPHCPELTLDTTTETVAALVNRVICFLQQSGYLHIEEGPEALQKTGATAPALETCA